MNGGGARQRHQNNNHQGQHNHGHCNHDWRQMQDSLAQIRSDVTRTNEALTKTHEALAALAALVTEQKDKLNVHMRFTNTMVIRADKVDGQLESLEAANQKLTSISGEATLQMRTTADQVQQLRTEMNNAAEAFQRHQVRLDRLELDVLSLRQK